MNSTKSAHFRFLELDPMPGGMIHWTTRKKHSAHQTLDWIFFQRMESVLRHFFKPGDYRLKARLNVEKREPSARESRYVSEVDVKIFSKNLHIVVKKIAGSFLDSVQLTTRALRKNIKRSKRPRMPARTPAFY